MLLRRDSRLWHTYPMATEDLEAVLRTSAVGGFGFKAAVELLVSHDYWLRRADFVEATVTVDTDEQATIDWAEAWSFCTQAEASDAELCVLRMACSLADPSFKVGLGEVGCLDHRNLNLLQDALYTVMFGVEAPATP